MFTHASTFSLAIYINIYKKRLCRITERVTHTIDMQVGKTRTLKYKVIFLYIKEWARAGSDWDKEERNVENKENNVNLFN